MRYIKLLIFISIILMACKPENASNNLEGIWIPEKINWEDGNFNTFYFFNDTSYIMLSSTQKYINDSIYFQAEPGYVLTQGIIVGFDSALMDVNTRILYRFFTLPGEITPSALINENILLVMKNKNVEFCEYKGVKYKRTNKYSNQSVITIKNIATKMVPHLNEEYGFK